MFVRVNIKGQYRFSRGSRTLGSLKTLEEMRVAVHTLISIRSRAISDAKVCVLRESVEDVIPVREMVGWSSRISYVNRQAISYSYMHELYPAQENFVYFASALRA